MIEEIKNILSHVIGVDAVDVDENADLVNEFGVDSFTAGEILVSLEQKYNIRIDEDEIMGIRTLKDIAAIVQKHIH